MTSSATPTYVDPDHLSARLFTDSSGNNAGGRGHFPFGETWYDSMATDKWKFTTYERDSESGLDYAMFRFDNSRLGRFQTPDPLGGSIWNPQSLNRYSYVDNDPINLIDPLGLCDLFYFDRESEKYICIVFRGGGAGGGPNFPPLVPPDDPTACGSSGIGGLGAAVGGTADVGVGLTGATVGGNAGGAGFHDQNTGLSAGGFASGGAAAYFLDHYAGKPKQKEVPLVFGAFIGGGFEVVRSNAGSVQQTRGPGQTLNVNVGVGPYQIGVSITTSSNGVETISISPPVVSWGFGASVSYLTTNTVTTHTGCE